MFNPDIAQNPQINHILSNKSLDSTAPANKCDVVFTSSGAENKELSVMHNQNSQPLTEEEQIIKDNARQSQLDEIASMKAQSQNLSQVQTIIRKDGVKFEIKNDSETSSTLKITTADNQTFEFKLVGFDEEMYKQVQLPKFQKLLDEIPVDVLKDLSKEIDCIRFMDDNYGADGVYAQGSGTIALTFDENTNIKPITLVHELGHAIDAQNGDMVSKSPDFTNKFEQFKTFAQKFGLEEYSLTNPQEFFASVYAYLSIQDDSESNHIAELDKQIEKLKNSQNRDAIECCRLLEELKQDVQNTITETRNQPQGVRFDTNLRDMVRKECTDIISEGDNYYIASQFIGQSTEMELTQVLSYENKDFELAIDSYNDRIQNGDYPDVITQFYEKMVAKLLELRRK